MSAARIVFCWSLVFIAPVASSQSPQFRDRNLETCLSGKYPALCDRSRLTQGQLNEARAAEVRENFRLCAIGKYGALCNHSFLTPEQAAQVDKAERAENFRVCSSGKYSALCKHGLLTPGELAQVRKAEQAENLRICMDGRYDRLCNRSLLTPNQATQVAAAEAKVAAAPRSSADPRHPSRGVPAGDCVRGHWIDSVMADGKVIKIDDGSMWEVDDVDTVITAIWLPVTDVIVCRGKMVNVDDNESVQVRPLSSGLATRGAVARGGYVIDAASNDETFVINGEVFKAQTYCFGFERGDQVRFLSGSPLGACAAAEILHLRSGKTCKVWCE